MKIRQLLSFTAITGLLSVAPLLVEGRPRISAVSTTAQAAESIELRLNEVDPSRWGWNYEGVKSHKTGITFGFAGDGQDRQLHLTGYDVDLADELSLFLNGSQIGFLATGPNNGHTAAQVIELPVSQQVAGVNTVEIREKRAGWRWGVTNVGLYDSVTDLEIPPRDGIVFSAEAPQDGLYCLSMSALNGNIYTAEPIESAEWQWRLANAAWSIRNMGEDVAWFTDAAERLCFYGEGLGEHRYANANIFKIRAVESGAGVTMALRVGSAPSTTASPDQTFPDQITVEPQRYIKTALFHDPDADFILAGYVANYGDHPRILAENFPTPDAAPGEASLQVNLKGGNYREGESHVVRVEINDVTVGQATWSGFAPKVLQTEFDSGILYGQDAGTQNKIEVIIESTETSVVWLDSFTLSYQRNYNATDGLLKFSGDNNELVTVSGFASAAVNLLDLSNPKLPMRVQAVRVDPCAGGHCASFSPAAPDVEYLAADQGVEPVVTMDQPASAGEGEYVIIVPESLLQGARDLQTYRDSDFSTVIKTLGQIYDEENFGIAHPDAIRSFLERAYTTWSVKPMFVTVLGKMTIDYQDHLGIGTGFVPADMVDTITGLYAGTVNTFSDFTGDGIPEIAIGHLPAVDSAEISDYIVNKLQPYEASVGSRSDSLLAADDDGVGNPYHARSDEIATLLSTLGGIIDYAYHQTGDPISVAKGDLLSSLETGVPYFNYKGHGTTNGFAAEELLRSSDVPNLTNNGRVPVLGAFTCYAANGTYPGYDSLVEELLFGASGGIAGALASTGPSDSVQSHWLNKGFVKAGFHADATSTTLGEAAIEGLRAMKFEGAMDFMAPTYGVFGCPALKIN